MRASRESTTPSPSGLRHPLVTVLRTALIVGVIVAALAIIVNFAWLPYYPVWSIVLILVGIAVIWALTVHGRDTTHA